MTPFAVTQRAARLAPELGRVLAEQSASLAADGRLTTEDVLRALYAAGLTLDADLAQPSDVRAALERAGVQIP